MVSLQKRVPLKKDTTHTCVAESEHIMFGVPGFTDFSVRTQMSVSPRMILQTRWSLGNCVIMGPLFGLPFFNATLSLLLP